MFDMVNMYVNLVIMILVVIVGIFLLVLVLMIIVIMFMLVSVWKKEIGILCVLGESCCDIWWLFMSELLIIGVISVLLVIGIVYGIGVVLNKVFY